MGDYKNIKWRKDEVDPEQVRVALQEIQLSDRWGDGDTILVGRALIAAARYAIENLQHAESVAYALMQEQDK